MARGEKTKLLWQDPEYRKRMVESAKKKVMTQQHKDNIRKSAIDNPNFGMRGKKQSDHCKDVRRKEMIGNKIAWKEDIYYNGIHEWLRREFGKADICESKDCVGKSSNFEWALLKGKKHERKRENYIKLCCSCHHKYDLTKKQLQALLDNAKWNKKN